jgi:hypothetical protein
MQALVAYLVVAGATTYAAWLLMPQALRRRIVAGLTRLAPSHAAFLKGLETKAECGGCSSCKGCEVGTQPAPSHPLEPTRRQAATSRAEPEPHS